jgi:hypothetical protein
MLRIWKTAFKDDIPYGSVIGAGTLFFKNPAKNFSLSQTKDFYEYRLCSSGTAERHTKYGCEGTVLDIECEEGRVISLVRANYGRLSISVCNELGNTTWSTNCIQPTTLRAFTTRYPIHFPQGADPLPLPLRVAKAGRNHLNEEHKLPPSSPYHQVHPDLRVKN